MHGVLGEECLADAFAPPCSISNNVLYAPANEDNPAFRAAMAALLGAEVDYFSAQLATPTLDELYSYAAVMTWCNYPYADNVAMGDVLADFVDAGGKVILGQWCFPTAGNYLAGRIMEDPLYCPVLSCAGWGAGTYLGDGMRCPTQLGPVTTLTTSYLDIVTGLAPGASWDGHIGSSYAAIWNADKNVWYSPGNLGGMYESGAENSWYPAF